MKIISRRRARECALQALYSWKLSKNDIKIIENYVIMQQEIQTYNISYFHILYFGIIDCVQELDELMIPYLSRNLSELGYIEHSVLLIALFELTRCFDVPYKVAINEAIEIAKIFGAEKSYRFINGVLDKVAAKIRVNER